MRSLCLALVFATASLVDVRAQNTATPAAAKPAPASPTVRVKTRVSRTAVWVGDPVTYEVEFHAAPNVEILTDDLDPDRLTMQGLEVLDVATERDESRRETLVHRVRYRLVSYDVNATQLTIAATPVRFAVRQAGQRPEDAAPAGEVTVPALVLAFRSTLPASQQTISLRDDKDVRPLPAHVRFARPVGLVLILLSIVPTVVWGAALVRRLRGWWARRPRRKPLRRRRATLESIQALPAASPADRREAYAQLDGWIREQLQESLGVAAASLTPAELTTAVRRPPKSVYLPDVERLLAECEQAKYAPEPPPADRWPAALEQAGQLLHARSR